MPGVRAGQPARTSVSAKVTHTSVPPLGPISTPPLPMSMVQWPAVRKTVGLSSVPEQLYQPGSEASKKIMKPTYGCAPSSGWP